MMRTRIYITIFFLFALSDAISAQENIALVTTQKEFVAGEAVVLKFNTKSSSTFSLYCTNSYGSTLVNGEQIDNGIAFKLPKHFTKKRGIIYWKVFEKENTVLEGNINIKPQKTAASLEMYLGPPSIEAGGTDFTMLVAIPTDSLDNPLPKNTKVAVKTQFLNDEKETEIHTNHLIAYRTIYSPLTSGRMLLSTNHQQKNSAEFDVNIVPAIPKNFL